MHHVFPGRTDALPEPEQVAARVGGASVFIVFIVGAGHSSRSTGTGRFGRARVSRHVERIAAAVYGLR